QATVANQAPAGWVRVTDNPRSILSNYVFSPEVADSVKAVINQSWFQTNDFGRAIMKVIGTVKQNTFSLSNFHAYTEGLHTLFSSPQAALDMGRAFISADFYGSMRRGLIDDVVDASRAGLTGMSGRMSPDIGQVIGDRLRGSAVSGLGSGASGYAA